MTVLVGYKCIEWHVEHSEAIYVLIAQPPVTSARARGAKDAPEIHTMWSPHVMRVLCEAQPPPCAARTRL